MHDAAKRVNRDILVLCHGGPIAEPADAQYVLDHTEGIVGFYGASSMERLPVEPAITERVREFASFAFRTGDRGPHRRGGLRNPLVVAPNGVRFDHRIHAAVRTVNAPSCVPDDAPRIQQPLFRPDMPQS